MDDSGSIPRQHVFTHPSPVEHWRHLVEIVALAIAAIWGFYIFVYQERIKPAGETPVLDIKPDVTTRPLRGGHLLVNVTLDTKNIGAADVQMAFAAVNVYGFKYGNAMTRTDASDRLQGRYSTTNVLQPSKDTLLSSVQSVFTPAGAPAAKNLYSPGREKVFGPTFAVPARDFDAVRLEFTICYTRADDKHVVPYVPHRETDGSWATGPTDSFVRAFECAHSAGTIFAI